MSEDRPVHTDALKTLGTIISSKEQRDAIHLAVEPVQAGENLMPGWDVGFLEDGTVGVNGSYLVGIVDPFLEDEVKKGEWFWLVVYPRRITSLRHVWEHPNFPKSTEPKFSSAQEKSMAAIKEICAQLGCRYDELMDHARYWIEYGDYWTDGGRWEGEYLPEEFWGHYEAVTGQSVEEDKKHSFFSCSC